MNVKYTVISPVRNVEGCIEQTLVSMINQTLPPRIWVIVDDGSTDNTSAILEKYARTSCFIRVARKSDETENRAEGRLPKYEDRLALANEAKAFNYGLKLLNIANYDFIVKLDGDLAFEPDYFERLFRKFFTNSKLGIAGGHCYQAKNGRLILEKVPDSHVRGATKVYRRQCFLDIGGIQEISGWDTIDEIRAQMNGWITSSFKELPVVHLRQTGSAGGRIWLSKFRDGQQYYYLGYHPLFMLARAFRRLIDTPIIVGGAAMLVGYLSSYFRDKRQIEDTNFRRFLQQQQMQRLSKFMPRVFRRAL